MSVTTVVVARDGRVWLPSVLAALAAQTVPADRVVAVDAGSADGSGEILREALGAERVNTLPAQDRPIGFGQAVAAGLASAGAFSSGDSSEDSSGGDTGEWIWLLHDDSAPDPQALERLLEATQQRPRAAIVGPKCLGWHDRRLLIEIGFSITGSGRRFTDLDPAEHDQGQHDGRDVVHAVGSAGMLIRRDVFDSLGGFDPALPLYRDDLDLCWRAWRAGHEVHVVPDAVLYHREASYHGRRTGSTRPGQGHRLDRRSAVHVLLAQAPAWRVAFTALRLAIESLVVAVIALLGKDARRASDEVLAWGSLAAHPRRLLDARRRIKQTSVQSSRAAVGEFRPGVAVQLRQGAEVISGWFTPSGSPDSRARESSTRTAAVAIAPETGPSDESMDLFEDGSATWLRRFFSRPGFILFVVSLVVTLAATRGLWWGEGGLVGGALLPAPAGAGDLWAIYTQTWHDVGPGSTVPAPAWVALLAAWSTVLLGDAGAAVASLILLAVPAAALSAWWSLRGVITTTPVRLWAAAAYALLPGMTGAIATGRIGTTAALIVLPPTARAIVRSLAGSDRNLPGLSPARARTPWWAALLLAAVTAFAPVLWPVTTLIVIIAAIVMVVQGRSVGALARAAIIVITPIVVLLPWSLLLFTEPSRLLLEPGLPLSAAADLSALSVLAVNPGGAGTPAIWVGAGIAIAGVLALLRIDRRRGIVIALLVAAVGLLAAVAVIHLRVEAPSAAAAIVPWPGSLTGLIAAGFITAAALAGDGLRQRMSGQAFTWRQPVSGVAAIAAISSVVVAAAVWVPGAGDPLRRGTDSVLPPFVAAEAQGPQAPRTLIVRPATGSTSSVSYALINAGGPTLADPDLSPPARAWEPLDRLVSTLVSGRGGTEVSGLADYAVRYVLAEVEPGNPLIRNLDAVPGLRRVAGDTGATLWRVDGATSRARAIPAEETAAGAQVVALPVLDLLSAQPFVNSPVPGPGEIRLAQDADAAWRAVLADGRVLASSPLPTGVEGVGLARFILPSSVGPGDRVVIDIDASTRNTWMWLQAGLVVLVIVLALPARRRAGRLADDAVDEDVRDGP